MGQAWSVHVDATVGFEHFEKPLGASAMAIGVSLVSVSSGLLAGFRVEVVFCRPSAPEQVLQGEFE